MAMRSEYCGVVDARKAAALLPCQPRSAAALFNAAQGKRSFLFSTIGFSSPVFASRWIARGRRPGRSIAIRCCGAGGKAAVSGSQPLPASTSLPLSASDVIWPSAGAFAAMAIFGRLDEMVASRGLSFSIAPLGAVCAVLFASPGTPAAKKYNMFVAQVGCAALGVLAFQLYGPGWLARAAGLAASIAFMIITRSTHPPAASLPILFVDGAKFHKLQLWYALFPGALSCILLLFIQEMVLFLKENCKF